MSLAVWISLGLVSLIFTLVLRISVRVLAKGADNGWDNALAYLIVTDLLFWFPIRWLVGSHSYVLIAFAPLVLWVLQTLSLRMIYEINTKRAWLIGIIHSVVTGAIIGTFAFGAAVVAAYILYGKVVSDPVLLLKLICRLIGIDWPF